MFSLKMINFIANLRLNVSMKNTVLVHVVDRLNDLVHVEFDSLFGQVMSSALDGFIHVHVHQFKDEGQSAGGFVIQNFVKGDYVRVGRKSFKGLNFSEVVHLYGVRYGNLLACSML